MESLLVRRRFDVIAGHLVSHGDVSATATHIFPMRCSSNLNSVIRRYDNITYFARQGSDSQAFFMRQASSEQGNYNQPGMHLKSANYGNTQSYDHEAPTFARPAQVQPCIPSVNGIQSAAAEAPRFARPSEKCEQPQFHLKESSHNLESKEVGWSPKMDVVESGSTYVVVVEISGVSIDKISVEINNQSLIVTGNRVNWVCGAENSNQLDSFYHRRDISPGPYKVIWQLPTNANKESVSAEIQDGFLRVTIPKQSGLRWLIKSHM